MSDPSRRQQILEALKGRLETIQVANGFNTDGGLSVFLGELPALGPDDPDVAIAMVVGDDEVRYPADLKMLIHLPIDVIAVAKPDSENRNKPWAMVEALLIDIKVAVELDDRQLGGLLDNTMRRGNTRTLPRETGSDIIGASITYQLPYVESFGGGGA